MRESENCSNRNGFTKLSRNEDGLNLMVCIKQAICWFAFKKWHRNHSLSSGALVSRLSSTLSTLFPRGSLCFDERAKHEIETRWLQGESLQENEA